MNKVIRKSNDLVEAQYTLNLWQMRVFIKMLSLINRDDTGFKEYKIELKDFVREFDLEKNKQAYALLKHGARGLLKKIIVLEKKLEDGSIEQIETPMVVGLAHNIDKKSYIKLSFHPVMRPYLLELRSHFLTYNLTHVKKLPSPYSIRLYELAKQYAKIGKRKMSLEKLKKMLGVEDKYAKYAHFKQKVLIKATEDITKHTDIILDFKEIKEGRRVAKLEFLIKKKEDEKEETASKDSITLMLRELGVSGEAIKKWKVNYSNEHILKRLVYLMDRDTSGNPITNKPAYLHTIMDKEISSTKDKKLEKEDITRRVNGILFSNPEVEKQIRAKHGNISQEVMEKIVKKKFPDRFK